MQVIHEKHQQELRDLTDACESDQSVHTCTPERPRLSLVTLNRLKAGEDNKSHMRWRNSLLEWDEQNDSEEQLTQWEVDLETTDTQDERRGSIANSGSIFYSLVSSWGGKCAINQVNRWYDEHSATVAV